MQIRGCGYSSMVEHLPSTYKILDTTPAYPPPHPKTHTHDYGGIKQRFNFQVENSKIKT